MAEIQLPAAWKDWEIEEEVGSGAFGAVYRVKREFQGKTFYSAVKMIPVIPTGLEKRKADGTLSDADERYYQDILQSCAAEIELMDALKGMTNIVSIEDYSIEENPEKTGWTIYIRMEFLQNLRQYISTKTLTEDEVIQVGADIAAALEECEKLKILHRDIKLDNIFVSPLGYFKLGDFGIARTFEKLSDNYSSKGTFSYMAPEVFHGEKYGPQADIYSLGVVLYRLMNRGRDPFVDPDKQMIYYRDREEALAKRMSGEAMPDPADASPELAVIIRKACQYKPEERYQSARQLKRDLNKLRTLDKSVIMEEESEPSSKKEETQSVREFSHGNETEPYENRSKEQGFKAETQKKKKHDPITLALVVAAFLVLGIFAGDLIMDGRNRISVETERDTGAMDLAAATEAVEESETTAASDSQVTQESTEHSVMVVSDVTESTELSGADSGTETGSNSMTSAENQNVYNQYSDTIDNLIENFVSDSLNTENLWVGDTSKPNAASGWGESNILCYSSDENVVTVTQGGKVTAVGSGVAYVVVMSKINPVYSAQIYMYVVI